MSKYPERYNLLKTIQKFTNNLNRVLYAKEIKIIINKLPNHNALVRCVHCLPFILGAEYSNSNLSYASCIIHILKLDKDMARKEIYKAKPLINTHLKTLSKNLGRFTLTNIKNKTKWNLPTEWAQRWHNIWKLCNPPYQQAEEENIPQSLHRWARYNYY